MQAIRLSDPDFMLVKAEWQIDMARTLLQHEWNAYVICVLDDYVLLSRSAFIRILDNTPGPTIADAVRGLAATPALHAAEDASALPDRAVIVSDGVVVGSFDITRPRPASPR